MDWIVIGPCVLAVALLVAIFGTIVTRRWFRHREIMAMVEKGIAPEKYTQYNRASMRERTWVKLLIWGIGVGMLGLALIIGLWPVGYAWLGGDQFPLGFGPWMVIGLLPLFAGIAMIIVYVALKNGGGEQGTAEEEEPASVVEE